MLVDGTFELYAFVMLGMPLQDARDEVVVEGGVGKTLPQGILLICQLLGEVARVSPGIGVGRGVGAMLV